MLDQSTGTRAATPKTERPLRSARQRLLDAADELFYAEGVDVVGIDRVIDRAGVAKASLYNTFGSKEELVRAYLRSRADRLEERIRRAVERHRDPRRRLLAVFDAQAEWVMQANYNGSAFAAASAQASAASAADQSAREYRSMIHALLVELAEAVGARRPEELAHQLQLLYDGAAQAGRYRNEKQSVSARPAASALVDAATA